MRFDAPAPFEGSFVEYTDRWKVKERREFFELEGDEYLALLGKKIMALRIEVEGDEPITQASELTPDRYEAVDGRLWDWFRATPLAALEETMRLGEAMRLQLFRLPETAASADTPNPS